jgi:hypothetical protein
LEKKLERKTEERLRHAYNLLSSGCQMLRFGFPSENDNKNAVEFTLV